MRDQPKRCDFQGHSLFRSFSRHPKAMTDCINFVSQILYTTLLEISKIITSLWNDLQTNSVHSLLRTGENSIEGYGYSKSYYTVLTHKVNQIVNKLLTNLFYTTYYFSIHAKKRKNNNYKPNHNILYCCDYSPSLEDYGFTF